MEASEFHSRLEHSLDKYVPCGPNREFIEIYNDIMLMRASESGLAVALAEKAFHFYKAKNHNFGHCLFLELFVRCAFFAGLLSEACIRLEELSNESVEADQLAALSELANNVRGIALGPEYSADVVPIILASLTRVYKKLGADEEVVRTFLLAANIYSSHGAHQAAYRALSDAEEVARRNNALRLLASVYADAAVIGYSENDFTWSVEVSERCLSVFEELAEPAPARVVLNLATAKMQLGKLEDAANRFQAYLHVTEHDEAAAFRAGASMNLAACLRKMNDLDGAEMAYSLARQCADEDHLDPEQSLELELIGARLNLDLSRHLDAVDNLQRATRAFEELLKPVHRLHHRRGIRERYVARFESIIGLLPSSGQSDDVLAALAAIYGGVVGDWLSILDWGKDLCQNPNVSASDKEGIVAAITSLKQFGAPFVMGYREKYDDPWSPLPNPQPWDVFGSISDRLISQGITRPTEGTDFGATVLLIKRRLDEGYCIIVPSYGGAGHLWSFHGRNYQRLPLDLRTLAAWKKAQTKFNVGEIDISEFSVELINLQKSLCPLLDPIFDSLDKQCPGLIYVQDFTDALPIMALALQNTNLRELMATGSFEVLTVPALYERGVPLPLVHPALLSVVTGNDGLGLASAEGEVAASILEARSFVQLESDAVEDVVNALRGAELLVVSTHGAPITLFSDPIYGSLGGIHGGHCISTDLIQREFPEMPYRLVLLNACNGAVSVARNYHQAFRTHDAASYPALLLLNRRCSVSAALWRLADTVSYLHTLLTAEGLREGLPPARALCRAAARIRQISTTDALVYLNVGPDTERRTHIIERIKLAPTDYFCHPYFTAGFAVYSLL